MLTAIMMVLSIHVNGCIAVVSDVNMAVTESGAWHYQDMGDHFEWEPGTPKSVQISGEAVIWKHVLTNPPGYYTEEVCV